MNCASVTVVNQQIYCNFLTRLSYTNPSDIEVKRRSLWVAFEDCGTGEGDQQSNDRLSPAG